MGGRPQRRRRSPRLGDGADRRARTVRGAAIGIGVGIALFGASLFAFAAVGLATGGDGKTTPATYVGLMSVFVAMIWWGLQLGWPELAPRLLARRVLAWRATTREPLPPPPETGEPDDDGVQRRVLGLAKSARGRLTAVEVAARCNMTADEATTVLNALVLQNVALLQVSESGVLVYVFPEFTNVRSTQRRGSPPQ
jgi:hypothetical protein